MGMGRLEWEVRGGGDEEKGEGRGIKCFFSVMGGKKKTTN